MNGNLPGRPLAAGDLPENKHRAPGRNDPLWLRGGLVAAALAILGLFVVLPLAQVFYGALDRGLDAYGDQLWRDRDTRAAIRLTLVVMPIAVVANIAFGVAAGWTIARFRFPGRTLLITLIDLPLAISPVVAGLMLVLLFGRQGYLGPWLAEHGVRIIFATPGLVLATTFVTLPLVARELVPLLEAIGPEEEIAALGLGANGWQMFWRVTLPNIRWGLLYGAILATARAMGEFGAVYVVSGHIAGRTDTIPLRIEKLFQEYNNPGSFALASLLTVLALASLAAKALVARYQHTAIELATEGESSAASKATEPLQEPASAPLAI